MPDLHTASELVGSTEGRTLLHEAGVYTDVDSFVAALGPAADPGVRDLIGAPPAARIICFGHQICCDYRRTVAHKFDAARQLAAIVPLVPCFVPVDTDRTGADPSSARVEWGVGLGGFAVRLVSNKLRSMETRFVSVEEVRREDLLSALAEWLRRTSPASADRWQPRLGRLAEALSRPQVTTMAEANLAVTGLLLHDQLGYDPPCVLVSELARRGFMTPTLTRAVEQIEDFIEAYNEAISTLTAAGIDPQVRALADDYLPLHFACPRDDRRLRLLHERLGDDHFAVAFCHCGEEYRFYIGSHSISLEEVLATDRWSTDVTFLLYLSDYFSGIVGGRSSALYGLVLNEVTRRVLDRDPLPLLLTPILASGPQPGESNSMLFDYLTG